MEQINEILEKAKPILSELYGTNNEVQQFQQERYTRILNKFKNTFSDGDVHLFSTPGRTEISGNHTDHNHGSVLAASIDLDTIAVASINDEMKVLFCSEQFSETFEVSLENLRPIKEEEGTTEALIRGIVARFKELGYKIGGFNAYSTSNVLIGSGLSSSASVEVLIGTIFNSLYNDGKISPTEIAQIAQYSENVFFGKPCGLMDQLACSLGGIISIDFKETNTPEIKKLNFDFNEQGYDLVIVNSGENHADLTDEYAAVPGEMKSVAKFLGGNVLRDISKEKLIENINAVRKKLGDRAVLRTIHFFDEQERVENQVYALMDNRFADFLELVNQSGNSSQRWLQNVFSVKDVSSQGLTLALALTKLFIKDEAGEIKCATRVHGGGFAGTIETFIKKELTENYKELMESVYGKGSVQVLTIRDYGSINISKLINRS